jgi:UDP-N-acetylglucosamine--N-acetylmuramyl-(pentapeptide) pyrophosphoryl-undecaprenol N-acetylglucosamine transferase
MKKQTENKRIIIAGGGTGGHIFPALAIANALKLKDPSIDLLFVGANGKMEMRKIPEAGYQIRGIDIAGFNRSSLIKNIVLPFKLVKSFFQVRTIFKSFPPDAVIGVGGYSSFPVLRYAQAAGIPSFIHESNAFAGKSNRLLGKKATKVFVAADGMEKFFPAEKIQVTGNPVRKNIVHRSVNRDQAIRFFGLDPLLQTVLVLGGSLGAKTINEAIDAGIGALDKNNLQLIWQTGKQFAARAAERAVEDKRIWANQFIDQMENAFTAADIVVSRAGAMTIAELCVVGKPVIFVPYPFAAEDHQTVNAQNLVNKQAGILVRDQEAKEKLIPALMDLASNQNRQQALKENIKKLAVTNADQQIAETILTALR